MSKPDEICLKTAKQIPVLCPPDSQSSSHIGRLKSSQDSLSSYVGQYLQKEGDQTIKMVSEKTESVAEPVNLLRRTISKASTR